MKIPPFSFKALLRSYIGFLIPLCLLSGIMAMFGISSVYWNDAPVHGVGGFLVSLLIIPIVGLGMASMNWLILNFGRWIYNWAGELKRQPKK